MKKKYYFIHTFGCQQNNADSERIAAYCESQGMQKTDKIETANHIIINTCMVRESAENRVYGLVNNLNKQKQERRKKGEDVSIIITGCMTGMATRDTSGKLLKLLHKRMPGADEFIPIEEIGFSQKPLRQNKHIGLIPITHGCNNFCSYCVVPYTRGREQSRPYQDILKEASELYREGFRHVQLLGQNVNSYGSDIVLSQKINESLKPVYVKHLGKYRIPTLFPHLLQDIAKIGFTLVDFMSSNPWDFSPELIDTLQNYPNITRTLHLAVQSGDDAVLKRMNRWYTASDFIALIQKIRQKIPDIHFTTDIIVGFCDETDDEFQHTIDLCKQIRFDRAYISIYSDRYGTLAHKHMKDNNPHPVKDKRLKIRDKMVN